ncbi:MAG: DUF445 family protein [Bacillota bacterium]
MDSVFIISPIVGSIIGYCTNWLAIKMLFRPLSKKEIFGFTIPFTPGVIPRRREELAESIGGTVGQRLLTPDAFEKILQGPAMKTKVKEFIKIKIKNLELEERSIEQILDQVFTNFEQTQKMKKMGKKLINKNIETTVKSGEISKLISSHLNSQEILKELEKYLKSDQYSDLKEKIIELIEQQSTKDSLQEGLTSYFKIKLAQVDDNKTVDELIPTPVVKTIKKFMREQKPEIIKQFRTFLKSDNLKEQIETKVENFFDNNPMLSMLSGFKDKIVEKFLNYLVSFAEEEENQEKIMKQLDHLLDTILATKFSNITTKLNDEDLAMISQQLVNQLLQEESLSELITIGEENLVETLKSDKSNQTIETVITKILESNLVIDILKDIVDFKVEKLFNTPLSDYFKNLEPDVVKRLEVGTVNIIEYIMEHHLGAVFASLDFKNLVKKKIDSFDVLEVERLLLDVIETELNAITWFGAVLGLLLGLITPIISLL